MKLKKFVLVFGFLVGTLSLAACGRSDETGGSSQVPPSESAATPNAEITLEDELVDQSTIPLPTPPPESASSQETHEPTGGEIVQPTSAERRRLTPEDGQRYEMWGAEPDAWIDADGDVWIGDEQITFGAGRGQATSDVASEYPNIPPPATNLHMSDMRVGNYPEEWIAIRGRRDIALSDFNHAIAMKNSNFQPQPQDFSWNNGVITVMPENTWNIGGNWFTMQRGYGLRAWYTFEITLEQVEFIWDWEPVGIDRHNRNMSGYMARWLWNWMASADNMTTIAEIELLQEPSQNFIERGEWVVSMVTRGAEGIITFIDFDDWIAGDYDSTTLRLASEWLDE